MPSHKIHCYVDRVLFGKSYWRLHREIDKPVLILGKRHRVLFHDGLSTIAIAQKVYPNDPRAWEAALVHVELDLLCSNNPFFAKQLTYFAEQDAKRRRSSRKGKKVPGRSSETLSVFGNSYAFLMKLEEIRRFAKMAFG